MSTSDTARDPRTDPRDGDAIKFRNGDTCMVLLRTASGVTSRLSFEGRTVTSTLAGWREFASAGEVIHAAE